MYRRSSPGQLCSDLVIYLTPSACSLFLCSAPICLSPPIKNRAGTRDGRLKDAESYMNVRESEVGRETTKIENSANRARKEERDRG